MAAVWKEVEYLMKERDCDDTWRETQEGTRLTDTDELGALVQYPDDGTDATDHLLPSALQKTKTVTDGSVRAPPSHMKPTHPVVTHSKSSKLCLSSPCKSQFYANLRMQV